ncbi:DNA ligase [Babesia ovis]|uniref:DNA ligase n=1 Tax=Babesia ovis TaxID=5869 RepID=A0A9W5WVU3_BABOV|nr:DNA ligase [Babesia ovis]
MRGSMDIKRFFQLQPNAARTTTKPHSNAVNMTSTENASIGEVSSNDTTDTYVVRGDNIPNAEENAIDYTLSWSQDDSCDPIVPNTVADHSAESDISEMKASSKKHKSKHLRTSEADEPAVGSLFNINVKPSDNTDDIMSPKFDPSLFDIGSYKSKSSAPGNKDSLLFSFLTEILQKVDNAFGSGTGSRKTSAEYEGEEIGVGDSMLLKAMAESYGKSEKAVKEMLTKHEDLGIVASLSSCTSQTIVKLPDLTISGVFNQFKAIAAENGKNSMTRKKDIIKRMLSCAKKAEAKYIVRCLQQKLRIGVNSATLFQSLADAAYLTKASKNGNGAIGDVRTAGIHQVNTLDEMEKAVKTATTYLPCIETVIGHLLDGDNCEEFLEHCKIRPGIPVRPMLAKAISKSSDILQAIGGEGVTFTCEYKYDGERVQIHLMKDRCIKLFSRNMENLCGKYPDVMENFLSCVKPDVKECIIDCEVVAYNPENGKILPFQQLSTRKRKGVTAKDISIPVCMYPFDILYLNGEQLVERSLAERRQALEATLFEKANLLSFARRKDMDSLDDIEDFLRQAVLDSCEGLMIKSLDKDATYEPQKRTNNWLKFKKDYIDGMGDSVDIVPIAAFWGKGKRTNVYGSYLLAVYDPVHEVYQSVCKTGTGFSDQTLKDLYNNLQEHIVTTRPHIYEVSDKFEPDVWFRPVKVWECKAADLSISPIHTAGQQLTPSRKGIGLRFPRFIRLREDKTPPDVTTSQQIYEMYEDQFNKPGFQESKVSSEPQE